jgi:hypothetical protein
MASRIRPDGALVFMFDGLPATIALPAVATAILQLIDGKRSLAAIRAAMAERGAQPAGFDRAWATTWTALNRVNRLLLAPPLGE